MSETDRIEGWLLERKIMGVSRKTSFDTPCRAPRAQPLRMTVGPAGSRILIIKMKTRGKETVSLSDLAVSEIVSKGGP